MTQEWLLSRDFQLTVDVVGSRDSQGDLLDLLLLLLSLHRSAQRHPAVLRDDLDIAGLARQFFTDDPLADVGCDLQIWFVLFLIKGSLCGAVAVADVDPGISSISRLAHRITTFCGRGLSCCRWGV